MLEGSVHSGKVDFLFWNSACNSVYHGNEWIWSGVVGGWANGIFLVVLVLNLLGINRTICCTEPTWRVFAPVWRNLQQQIPFKQSDHHFSVKKWQSIFTRNNVRHNSANQFLFSNKLDLFKQKLKSGRSLRIAFNDFTGITMILNANLLK